MREPLLRRAGLPIGLVGVAVGCLVAWKHTLHAGIFDDTYWHWASGIWMLDHHRVMTRDVYSYTAHGASWITPEWGYGVVLAEGVRTIGSATFWLLSAGLASLTVFAVAIRCRLLGAGWTWTGILCVEAGAAVTLFSDVRPQMVSYFFFALLLMLLALARRRSWILWVLPPLFVLWANLHGSFLLGLLVLVLELVGALVPRRLGRLEVLEPLERRPALLVLVASGLATFVNPFGPNVYSSALGVTFNSTVRSLIQEWQSPDFHDLNTLAVVVLPLVFTVAFLAFSRRTMTAFDVVLVAFLLVSTLDASRFLPYFAIAWCGLAARSTPLPTEQLKPTLLTWAALGLLAVVFESGSTIPPGQAASSVPVQAVSYLKNHPGRVFSTYLWNDYLDYENVPVFVDGRTEIFTGNGVLRRYVALQDVRLDPDPVLRSYRVNYVLWPPDEALSIYLQHDDNWQVVRRSKVSVIFRYVGGANTARRPATI